jgi:hypothetical protein
MSISAFDTPSFKRFTLEKLKSLPANLAEDDEAFAFDPAWGFLVRPAWVAGVYHDYGGEQSAMFQARCLGNFPGAGGDDSLIGLTDVEAAIERWKHESRADTHEPISLAADIARYGSNFSVVIARQGSRVLEMQAWRGNSLMETTGKIGLLAKRYQPEEIRVDDSGVGGGVTDRLSELGFPVRPVIVGTPARDSSKFFNLKAELFWNLRVLFRQGAISIPPDPDLVNQLTALRYEITSTSKIKIESKDDLIRRGVESPDKADALMLAFAETQGVGRLWEYFKQREAEANGQRSARPSGNSAPAQSIGEPSAEDRAAADRWWRGRTTGQILPAPAGYREIKAPMEPIQLVWVGREAAPGEQMEPEETFEQIGREQTYSMVRDMPGAPEALQRRFPNSMDPRRPFDPRQLNLPASCLTGNGY